MAFHDSIKKNVPLVILLSFLITFLTSRLIVYLMVADKVPEVYMFIKGVHVHHLNYGILILAFVGAYCLLKKNYSKPNISVVYGIGLGLTFDEFGMWLMLQDNYWIRQSYDAIIAISAALVIAVYMAWKANKKAMQNV
jgi:hypothetical protein